MPRLPRPVRSISLAEWSSGTYKIELSERDRGLAARLRTGRRLEVEELRDGVRIRSSSWIGVVRFEHCEVRVRPKLAGEALGVARMLEFTNGIERLQRTAGVQSLATDDQSDLLELLALLLLEETERVVRGGFVADYQEHEDELSVMRGRLLVDKQLLVRFGQVDKVWCRFDELEHDTDDNRLLCLALLACAHRVKREQLHRRLRALAALFQELCSPEAMDPQFLRETRSYDRKNAHYRGAHDLAALILDSMGIEDVFAANQRPQCFAFMLDMNVLFEDFVTRLVAKLFPPPGFRVESQERNRSVLWHTRRQAPYGSIRPDIVVRRALANPRAVAIDAKYKRYDVDAVANADIYQALLYAQAYGRNEPDRVPAALIVHPTESEEAFAERIELRRPGNQRASELIVVGLPVKRTLDELMAGSSTVAELIRSAVELALQ